MMWSSVSLFISSSDAPLIWSLRVCASDWISDPPVPWINSWNWLSTFSKWDFVEMEYPVRDVAAFRSPPMILRRPSNLFISAWMWVFTHLWRSGRLAVAWWMLIILIRSPSCVIASSHKRVHGPCVPAPFFRGVYVNSQPVLWGETHVCAERWLLWYALFRHCIHHLALGQRPYLLLSQCCCLQEFNICTLDTSAGNLAEL